MDAIAPRMESQEPCTTAASSTPTFHSVPASIAFNVIQRPSELLIDDDNVTPPTSVASSHVASPSKDSDRLSPWYPPHAFAIEKPGDGPTASTVTGKNTSDEFALRLSQREDNISFPAPSAKRPRRQAAIKADQMIKTLGIYSAGDSSDDYIDRPTSSSSSTSWSSQLRRACSNKRSISSTSSITGGAVPGSNLPSSSIGTGIVEVPRGDPRIMAMKRVAPDEPVPLVQDERLQEMQKMLEDLSLTGSGQEILLRAMLKKSGAKAPKSPSESSKKEGCRVKHTTANDTTTCEYCQHEYTYADSARACEKSHHVAQVRLLRAQIVEPGNEGRIPVLHCLFCAWNTTQRGTRNSPVRQETMRIRPENVVEGKPKARRTKKATKRRAGKPSNRRPKSPFERSVHALNQHYENEHDHRPYISPCPGGPRFCKARHDNYVKHIHTVYRRVVPLLAREATTGAGVKRQHLTPPNLTSEAVRNAMAKATSAAFGAARGESRASPFEELEGESEGSLSEVPEDDNLSWLSEQGGDISFIYGDFFAGDDNAESAHDGVADSRFPDNLEAQMVSSGL